VGATHTVKYFLKSSRRESKLLCQISNDNPQKIIFTISFLVFTGHDERCRFFSETSIKRKEDKI